MENKDNDITSIEWLEKQIKTTYDNEGKLPIAYILDLVNQAKNIYEQETYKEYMNGYSAGWRECVDTFNNDVTILYNKYVNNR